jgi:putative mRNA 3-end processing factor
MVDSNDCAESFEHGGDCLPRSLVRHPAGVYCPEGGFFVDPERAVDVAVITHAHSDHARPGHGCYHVSRPSVPLLRGRIPSASRVVAHEWGVPFRVGAVWVSLHPAGHVLGSAQVRVEGSSEVWVVTGDFKREPDRSCETFETVACDGLVLESTFALPIYQWEPSARVFAQIQSWIAWNRKEGVHSVFHAYSLGKAQRLLAGLERYQGETIWVHSSIELMNRGYREAGIDLPITLPLSDWTRHGAPAPGRIVITPPSADLEKSLAFMGPCRRASVSGWNLVEKLRCRGGEDAGFVLSDHADWSELLQTVRESGARKVRVMHGQTKVFARYLREELSLDAEAW